MAKYAACSGECFVLALVYIDRIIQSNPTFVVNSLNIHRLLITSIMLAAKFFDDQYFNNGNKHSRRDSTHTNHMPHVTYSMFCSLSLSLSLSSLLC